MVAAFKAVNTILVVVIVCIIQCTDEGEGGGGPVQLCWRWTSDKNHIERQLCRGRGPGHHQTFAHPTPVNKIVKDPDHTPRRLDAGSHIHLGQMALGRQGQGLLE